MGKIAARVAPLLCLVAGIQPWAGVEAELVLLVTLTRHGSRAPNPVIDELCPENRDNRAQYNVPPGQLTEIGMKQALKLGTYLREEYVESMDFLPPSLGNGSERSFSSKFMSDSAERCLQTAQVVGMGLFPNGTGPPGFPNQPVAVETEQKEFATLLAAAQGVCLPQQKADNAAYDLTRGKDLIGQNKNITDVIAQACGTPTENYAHADNGREGLVLGVKDVGDMLDFDEQQGLPGLESVSKKNHEEMTQLAFTLLQERYYSNRRQITYWSGDFPTTLLDSFHKAVHKHSKGKKPARLYLGYHGHRELLYGLAHFLGWKFDVEGAPTALGTSSIPPATTMIFELHYSSDEETDGSDPEATNHSNGHEDVDLSATTSENEGLARGGEVGYYYVRPYTWTPDFGKQEVVLDACRGAEAVKGNRCRLTTLEAVVLESIKETGSWQDICRHVPFDQAEKLAQRRTFGVTDDATTGLVENASYNKARRPFFEHLINLMTSVGVVASIAVVGAVTWLGAIAAKTTWRSVAWRGVGYQVVP
ncbi:unnamed protein product [Pylaiella littoralis]